MHFSISFRWALVGIACSVAACSGTGPERVEPAARDDAGEDASRVAADGGSPPSSTDSGVPVDGAAPEASAPSAWFGRPRSRARVFVSGHSLLDHVAGPIQTNGGPFSAIAQAAGMDHGSQLQSGPGSTARLRREDIETRRYPEPNWASFDTLVVTERADPVRTVIHEQTFASIGWFVDRIRAAPPGGDELFLYQTWFGFHTPDQWGAPDLSTWPIWEDYQREELKLIECIAERVGRARGIAVRVLPAGLALARLTAAIRGGSVPGVTSPHQAFNPDNVHLADLGHAFLGLVMYSAVYHRPSAGLTVPGIPAGAAPVLQRIADDAVSSYYDGYRAPTAAACRATLGAICTRWNMSCTSQEDALFGDRFW